MEIDQKAIETAVIEQAAGRIAESIHETRLDELRERVEQLVEEVVIRKCDEVVRPVIEAGVEGFVIEQTNTFGEKKGEPVTFAEYVTQIAETWLGQKVDHSGKAVDSGAYGGREAQSRLTHLLDEHLQYRISGAMKDAVNVVVAKIAPAIATTCELKVKEATNDIRRAMGR